MSVVWGVLVRSAHVYSVLPLPDTPVKNVCADKYGYARDTRRITARLPVVSSTRMTDSLLFSSVMDNHA